MSKDKFTPRQAVWKNKDSDRPVTVIGEAGEADGVLYYTIEGSATAISEDDLVFDFEKDQESEAQTDKTVDTLQAEKDAEARAREAADGGPKEKGPVDTSPNVIYVATRSRNGQKERLTEAPRSLISGPDTFDGLPSSGEQLEGFYYEKAAELCRAFPGLYKPIIKKGE